MVLQLGPVHQVESGDPVRVLGREQRLHQGQRAGRLPLAMLVPAHLRLAGRRTWWFPGRRRKTG